jgi:hypothetical protein
MPANVAQCVHHATEIYRVLRCGLWRSAYRLGIGQEVILRLGIDRFRVS